MRNALLILLSLAAASAAPRRSGAAEREEREFTVTIDGKRAGSYHMAIARDDDGSTTLTARADVRHRVLFVAYAYTFRGTEVWKDGRLHRLESTSDDDGKRFRVEAETAGDQLRIKADGRERDVRPDVWTTTYWHRPDARFRGRSVPLIDADTARELRASLHHVGRGRVSVAGREQVCDRYRVSGEVQADLWYDEHDRLVRRESVEDGHRTVLELTALRR